MSQVSENATIWVVGLCTSDDGHAWEFCDAFTEEAVAVSHCTTPRHWVGREQLNRFIPTSQTWPDC